MEPCPDEFRRRLIAWRLMLAGALLIGLASLPGCVAAGAAAYALMGDNPVDAQYKLPHRPTLVFVENYSNPDATNDDADVLSRYIVLDLKKHLDAKKKKGEPDPVPLIDPMAIYNLRAANPVRFHKMKIQEIGRDLHAAQIIYVSLDSLGLQSMGTSEMMHGVGSARVKVISAATGLTLWPMESSGGYPAGYQSKLITPQQDVTYDQARDQTLQAVAHSIARLFYKWNPADEPDENEM